MVWNNFGLALLGYTRKELFIMKIYIQIAQLFQTMFWKDIWQKQCSI